MGSIFQSPLLPKGEGRGQQSVLCTQIVGMNTTIYSAAKEGDRPLCGSCACKHPKPRKVYPINCTKISARVQDEGTALVLQAPVTQATCPCQELVAFMFKYTNRCIQTWYHNKRSTVQRFQHESGMQWGSNVCVTSAHDTCHMPFLGTHRVCVCMHQSVHTKRNIATNGHVMAKFVLS